ncbi:hypothetical protein CLV51_110112 [Chitinophaga niastensis]|uniref:Quinol monooxygenase YgiN n=1 Tax=Chitinophaga niastensis TaxID=536980 RepID=A0A2P8H9J3_CHINA|nr:hypothetical protein [Chitinophaga niastensis]PSL42895.1 hypothetical protein CLV51_110112 [Chitinophaga niastensis]
MKKVIVHYKVKAEKVQQNDELSREILQELHASQPVDFQYSIYKLADGVSYMHIAHFMEDNNPLLTLPAFKKFQLSIKERCDEAPVVTVMEGIGFYNMLSA